jgi:uncharacterized protein YegP (UPF0339 family)
VGDPDLRALGCYFKIRPEPNGFRAVLYSHDGDEPLWWSRPYPSRTGAMNAIDELRIDAATAPIDD